MVSSNNLKSRMMESNCQFSTTLKFLSSMYQRGNLIRSFAMKIFIEQLQGSYFRQCEFDWRRNSISGGITLKILLWMFFFQNCYLYLHIKYINRLFSLFILILYSFIIFLLEHSLLQSLYLLITSTYIPA